MSALIGQAAAAAAADRVPVSTPVNLPAHPLAGPSSGFPTTSWHPLSRQAPPVDSRQHRYDTLTCRRTIMF